MNKQRKRDRFAIIRSVLRGAKGKVRGADNALALLEELEQNSRPQSRRPHRGKNA